MPAAGTRGAGGRLLGIAGLGLALLAAPASAAPLQDEQGFAAEDASVAIRSGLDYLIAHQNEDGSWGGFRNATFTSGFANPATYETWQIGTTALSVRAILELDSTSEYAEQLERGLDFLIANSQPVRPAEWDVDNNWSLVYGLDAVAKAL